MEFNLPGSSENRGPKDCTLDSSERGEVSCTNAVYPKLMGSDQKERALTNTHLLYTLDTADNVPRPGRRPLNEPLVFSDNENRDNPSPPPTKRKDPVIETTIQE
jgi:hypothetical protein